MIFSALYDYTNIFSIWQQDQSAAISKLKFWKFLIDHTMGFNFLDFFSTMRLHKYFFLEGRINGAATIKYYFQKFLIRRKVWVYFSWFYTILREFFFDFAARSKCGHPKINFFKILIEYKIRVYSSWLFQNKNSYRLLI